MKERLLRHPLIHTLMTMTGNARGAVLTEPLWGIPFSLYAPYVSVYMLALGLRDSQIGLVASINMGLQVFWSLMGGAITDKLGRKRTTLIFDLISWSIPCLIWAFAQNFTYFVVAAVINSCWRVTHTSWTCLWVEDTDPELLVDLYTWIYISGLLSAFFTPLAGLLISGFTLVPTVRGLYLFSFVMMTIKFLVMNNMVEETERGKIRMEQTRNQSLFSLLKEYSGVGKMILRTPTTLYTMGMMLVMSIFMTINGAFWSVLVTQRLNISDANLALFPFLRSVTQLIFFFLATPFIRKLSFRNPILAGLTGYILSQTILITAPPGSYLLLFISVVLDACSAAAVNIQVDRMFVVNVNPEERARIMAVVMMFVVGGAAPFGFIAGRMSEINRILPFAFNILLFLVGMVIVWLAARYVQRNNLAQSDKGEIIA